jgi:hypothetical protein
MTKALVPTLVVRTRTVSSLSQVSRLHRTIPTVTPAVLATLGTGELAAPLDAIGYFRTNGTFRKADVPQKGSPGKEVNVLHG